MIQLCLFPVISHKTAKLIIQSFKPFQLLHEHIIGHVEVIWCIKNGVSNFDTHAFEFFFFIEPDDVKRVLHWSKDVEDLRKIVTIGTVLKMKS